MAAIVIEEEETPGRINRKKTKAAKTPKSIVVDEHGNTLGTPQCVKDLEMIFSTFSQEFQPPPANQAKCKSISEKVCSSAQTVKRRGSFGVPLPVIQYQDAYRKIPTHTSYEEALNFYELKLDSYMTRESLPLDSIITLELWFIQIIEPPPQLAEKIDAWRAREMFKVEQGFTKYLPQSLQLLLFNRITPLLPVNWASEYTKLISYAESTSPAIMIVQEKAKIAVGHGKPKVMANIAQFKKGAKK